MIWIVSKAASNSEKEMVCRHYFIEDVTQASVSPWMERTFLINKFPWNSEGFYQCTSDEGEYGIVITAHINEVPVLLENVLTNKKNLVIVNSCIISNDIRNYCMSIVKAKNTQSELYFAKQEILDSGVRVNYIDNVGTFGFGTSVSERELFRHRKEGLVKAISLAFDKVVVV